MAPTESTPREDVPPLPPRPLDGHKGTFGRVFVVAGSRGMSGAAVLCASAALRGGAGLVRLAIPTAIQEVVAAANPCYTTIGLPSDSEGRLNLRALFRIQSLAQENDVLAVGPGLGNRAAVPAVIRGLLNTLDRPLVLDADGLNALVASGMTLGTRTAAPTLVLTPHPGEFGRLLGISTRAVQEARAELAVNYAQTERVILVLKGHQTLVTDGIRLYRNPTGNPGMATGGSGDVLTGLIAALLGQGLDGFAAARLGVFVHGRAGDLASASLGETSLVATDLLIWLPRAFRSMSPADRAGAIASPAATGKEPEDRTL